VEIDPPCYPATHGGVALIIRVGALVGAVAAASGTGGRRSRALDNDRLFIE
jgi:hypothetical protein